MAMRPKTLRLPDNPYRCQQLRAKLQEYFSRLPGGDLTEIGYVDAAIKFFILHCLLESEHGRINTDDIYHNLASTQPGLWKILSQLPLLFDNACLVINNYCTGQTERNLDSTGLPELN